MSQITSGLRALLSNPTLYSIFQDVVGSSNGRGMFVDHYLRPQPQHRVLEIGCGPGDYSKYFSDDIQYTGVDLSQPYIDSAKKKYSSRKNLQFICSDVNDFILTDSDKFDVCFAAGLLHHLNDDECITVFKIAQRALKSGGRFVCIDGVFAEGQSRLARYVVSKDRGQNIRTPSAYEQLATSVFEHVTVSIRHDLLRIPYTHIIIECIK